MKLIILLPVLFLHCSCANIEKSSDSISNTKFDKMRCETISQVCPKVKDDGSCEFAEDSCDKRSDNWLFEKALQSLPKEESSFHQRKYDTHVECKVSPTKALITFFWVGEPLEYGEHSADIDCESGNTEILGYSGIGDPEGF